MAGPIHDAVRDTIVTSMQKAPEWIRHDLGSKDKILRSRAEETLAGMIAGALAAADVKSRE